MWIYYNPNPRGVKVGDCAVRAVSLALGDTWDAAYTAITLEGFSLKDMPSSNAVWGSLLKRNGFKTATIPDSCPNCYTAADFCRDHPIGLYVLAFGGHVATVVDGDLYDSWDSSNEIPMYYFYMED